MGSRVNSVHADLVSDSIEGNTVLIAEVMKGQIIRIVYGAKIRLNLTMSRY